MLGFFIAHEYVVSSFLGPTIQTNHPGSIAPKHSSCTLSSVHCERKNTPATEITGAFNLLQAKQSECPFVLVRIMVSVLCDLLADKLAGMRR